MPTAHTLRARRHAGFTLLETIACIAIIGTSLVAAIALFGMTQEVARAENGGGSALRFLAREMERARSTDYASLASQDYAPVPEDPSFKVCREVSPVGADMKRVVTRVRWTTPQGIEHTDSVETIRCEGVGR
ncbi:MAG: type II secretion system GspH family protein [Planctomycetes bacterium]|nr:type II secretion system GspH family protein [Planctomycetota bacterium]